MELVGAKVYSEDKDGVDAGVLAGRQPCGVVATQDVDEILALGADCVAYFPRHRLARRGLPDPGQWRQCHHHGLPLSPTVPAGRDLARLEAACARGARRCTAPGSIRET